MKRKTFQRLMAGFLSLLMVITILPAQYLISNAAPDPFNLSLSFVAKASDTIAYSNNDTVATWTGSKPAGEEVTIQLAFTNHEGSYNAGSLNFYLLGPGKSRNGAVFIPERVKLPDGWTYLVDSEGIITVTNTATMDMSNAANGIFQFSYNLNPRQMSKLSGSKGESVAAVSITGSMDEICGESNSVFLNYTPVPDTFQMNTEYEDYEVEQAGDLPDDSYWAKYTTTITPDEIHSQEATKFQFKWNIPNGGTLYSVNESKTMSNIENNTLTIDTSDYCYYINGTKKDKVLTYVIRYPKSRANGSTVELPVTLDAKFIDADSYVQVARNTKTHELHDYKTRYEGDLFGVTESQSPNSIISYNSLERAKYSRFHYYIGGVSRYRTKYDVSYLADYLEFKGKNGAFFEVPTSDYQYTEVTLNKNQHFTNADENEIPNLKYIVDAKKDGVWSKVDSGTITDNKQSIRLTNKATSIRVRFPEIQGTLNLSNTAIMVSGIVTGNSNQILANGRLSQFVGIEATQGDTILNPVDVGSYTGSDAIRLAKRDKDTYGHFVQRDINYSPVVYRNVSMYLSENFEHTSYKASKEVTNTTMKLTSQLGTPGKISSYSIYTLLPKGMEYTDSVTYSVGNKGLVLASGEEVSSEEVDSWLKNGRATIKVTKDYKNSKQDKVEINFRFLDPICYDADSDALATSDSIQVQLGCCIRNQSYATYGGTYTATSAMIVEDENENSYNQDRDNAKNSYVSDFKELWTDINENNNTNEPICYAKNSVTITKPIAVQQGLEKMVSVDGGKTFQKTSQDTPAIVSAGGTYIYRLQLSAITHEISGIQILDYIEKYGDGRGIIQDIRLQDGYQANIFVSSQYSQPGSNEWKAYTKGNSDVRAIYVDYGDTVLAANESTYVDVYMVAPTENETTSLALQNHFTVNTTLLNEEYASTSNDTYVTVQWADAPNIKVTKTARKDAYTIGDTATYDIVVTNTGNVTLKDIKVVDSLDGSFEITNGVSFQKNQAVISQLKPGESIAMVYYVILTDAYKGMDGVINQVNVEEKISKVTDSAEELITLTGTRALSIDKSAPKNTYLAGETIPFQIKVKNSGESKLKNVVVTESMDGVYAKSEFYTFKDRVATINEIAAGETVTLEYLVASPSDVKVSEQLTNIAEATCSGIYVKDEETVTIITAYDLAVVDKPSIAIKKYADKKKYRAGEVVTYHIQVTNNGSVNLTNIVVSDSLEGNFVATDGITIKGEDAIITSLKKGESKTIDYQMTVPTNAEVEEIISNTATAKETLNQIEVKDTYDITIIEGETPQIVVEKTALDKAVNIKDSATFQIVVTNTGNVDLTNVVVSDYLDGQFKIKANRKNISLETNNQLVIKSLPANCSETFRFEYQPTKCGKIKNTVMVTEKKYQLKDKDSASILVSTSVVRKPKTGDTLPFIVFTLLSVIALLGMVATCGFMIKKKKAQW